MKNKINQLCSLTVLIIFAFTNNVMNVVATTTSSEKETHAALSVKTVIPENQRDKTKTYFDLRMKPGQKQLLVVQLINSSAKEITVEIQANDATTNNNGIVEYSKVEKKRDASLKVGFSDIATTENEVKVPANATKEAIIAVVMPSQEFDGEILGGLYIKEKNQKTTSKDSSEEKGSGVINRFAYTIGVVLTENDHKVAPNIQLNAVSASQSNYRNMINATIQNNQAVIIKNAHIDIKLYRKGADKPLLAQSTENIRMAPNSNFDYMISMDNKPFNSGSYVLKGVFTVGEQQWNLEKEFTISNKEAKKYNDTAVDLEKEPFPWVLVISIVAVFVLLVVIIILLIYKSKKKNGQKKRRKKSTKKPTSGKNKKRRN